MCFQIVRKLEQTLFCRKHKYWTCLPFPKTYKKHIDSVIDGCWNWDQFCTTTINCLCWGCRIWNIILNAFPMALTLDSLRDAWRHQRVCFATWRSEPLGRVPARTNYSISWSLRPPPRPLVRRPSFFRWTQGPFDSKCKRLHSNISILREQIAPTTPSTK